MPPVITSIAATTELDALNELLSVIGESPYPAGTDLDTLSSRDVDVALNILRDTTRVVTGKRWKFNTEWNYPIAPADAAFSWTEYDSSTKTLSVFLVPTSLASFEVATRDDQQGTRTVDTMIRQARQYNPTPGTFPDVFYDRTFNRDGFEDRSYLFIDATWYVDFEKCPDVARRFIVASASRLYAHRVVGDPNMSRFTEQDVGSSWNELNRVQGEVDFLSIFDNNDVAAALGDRGGYHARGANISLRQQLGVR
jgi:hypothetical protein